MTLRQTAEAFYFPGESQDSERAVSERAFASRLLEHMRRPEELAAEMYHLGIDPTQIGEYTNLPDDIVERIGQGETERVQSAVKSLDQVVQALRVNGPPFDYDDIVLAGMVACEYSHWGVVRKNGKDYFTHPAAVAAIAEKCWQIDPADNESRKRLERILFVALAHDTFEDSMPDDGSSFLASDNIVVSPLFVHELFSFYGRDDGAIAAEDLLLLTKFRQNDAKISNDEYLARLKTSPDAMFVKICDIQYNAIIDPKGLTDTEKAEVEKNERRALNYRRSTQLLLVGLNDRPIKEQMNSHRVTGIDRARFSRMSSQLTSYRPADYVPVYDMMHEAA